MKLSSTCLCYLKALFAFLSKVFGSALDTVLVCTLNIGKMVIIPYLFKASVTGVNGNHISVHT